MNSYSSIYNLGHKRIETLFNSEVLIEEKVDGSQFSFGMYEAGGLIMKSKGAILYPPIDNKLFKGACEYVMSIRHLLPLNWTFRGEVLFREHHNTLTYGRVPLHNIVIFDIDMGDQKYVSHAVKCIEAARLDLEVVPAFWHGLVKDVNTLREFFDRESFLGGSKIEGFVIKAYDQFGVDKKTLMGKWVSEKFKEDHKAEWKKSNPNSKDVVQNIILMYKTEATWNKAIQHLREDSKLLNAPQDIGPILKEIGQDVFKERAEEIKEELFKQAWPQISRGIMGGFPEFYKQKLAESMFKTEEVTSEKL